MPNWQVSIVHSFKVDAMLMFISRSQIRRQDFPFVLAKAVEKGCFLYIHCEFLFRLLHCCIVIVYISIVLEKRMFGRVDGWQGGGLCKHTISQLYWATKILKYKNTKLQKCTNVKIQKVEMLHIKDTMEFKQNCSKSAWTFQFF